MCIDLYPVDVRMSASCAYYTSFAVLTPYVKSNLASGRDNFGAKCSRGGGLLRRGGCQFGHSSRSEILIFPLNNCFVYRDSVFHGDVGLETSS